MSVRRLARGRVCWASPWTIGIRAFIAGGLVTMTAASGHIHAAGPQQRSSSAPASSASPQRALLNQYCVTCHNQRLKDRGTVPVALDTLDISNVGANAETWEKVVVKMRAGLMPPAGTPRPDKTTHDRFATWLELELDRAAAAKPNPGRTEPFHRLNRAEYQNAIRDLLGVEIDVASLLPADDVSVGFDNIASVLSMSPTLMDRYLAAAQKVSRVALGIASPVPNTDYFRLADDLPQDDHLPGLPFGTRGGTVIRYTFPVDGEYVIRVRLARDLNEGMPVFADPQHLEISVDGERVQVFTLPGVELQPPAAQQDRNQAPDADQDQPQAERSPQPAAGQPPPQPQRPAISQRPQTLRLGQRERAMRNRADDNWNVRFPATAGEREISVAFVKKTSALDETARLPFLRPYPAGNNVPETRMGASLRSVEISGPYTASGPGDSASRQRIFVCRPPSRDALRRGSPAFAEATARPRRPASAKATAVRRSFSEGGRSSQSGRTETGAEAGAGGSASSSAETGCARTILSALTRRAYRRPVTDADVEPLLALYDEGRTQGGFDAGIERALKRLLVSPEFLYRVEVDPPAFAEAAARPRRNSSQSGRTEAGPRAGLGTVYRISDLELASRLSFFLWSSIPDDELLDAASKGRLKDPAVLGRQVRRMMADRRSEAFVKNFAGQWLFLRNVPLTGPVQSVFPDFDDSLRQAFRRETELFFESIVREDRSALDLLRADYTFVNERLARHYGIPNVTGSHFRRVSLGRGHARSGLLGHGSILTVTSYPDRTSPVVRGKWILENLLGTPPPPPLPDVADLKPTDATGTVLSMRERMAQHRANPACASCHSMMDPLGLALENFDAVGKWRTLGESALPIDASAVLPDGTMFEGPAGLRQALLARSDRFVSTLTEKLLTYALGRRLEYYDAPAVRAIARAAARNDFRFASSLIAGVVQSTPFRMRKAQNE